jgi:hypothetical protein
VVSEEKWVSLCARKDKAMLKIAIVSKFKGRDGLMGGDNDKVISKLLRLYSKSRPHLLHLVSLISSGINGSLKGLKSRNSKMRRETGQEQVPFHNEIYNRPPQILASRRIIAIPTPTTTRSSASGSTTMN